MGPSRKLAGERHVRTILFSVMVSRKVSISQIEILAVAPAYRILATGSDRMIGALTPCMALAMRPVLLSYLDHHPHHLV